MGTAADDAAEFFQRNWGIYRKMLDNNYMNHREAYGRLRQLLVEEAPAGFRFMDIACGDATASITAIDGTAIGHYHGIDLSAPALKLARQSLRPLVCPVLLDERDFHEALLTQSEAADVVWIGLSLHHFQRPEKAKLMRAIRGALAEDGVFAIYENAGPDGESRDGWLTRWDAQRPGWTAYDDAEWDSVVTHVHGNDYPETDESWRALGREAGFGAVRELYRTPSDLFRLYAFTGWA